jgi:hypothetical protein
MRSEGVGTAQERFCPPYACSPHSSFHRLVARGVYPGDWAGNAADPGGNFGER